ncbi:metal ABC transporter ATP-binding protein [Candidatus Saccharibacteria bacterium]|nr:metal ABC transporter ATP-binding protein [Candidatus Saccharibacteria bacterium]
MGEKILEVRGLRVKYGENDVIKSASFVVERGDFVCVVGANGAGKTTLIKTLLGLVRPMAGEIRIKNSGKAESRRAGFLPQESKIELGFPATVFEIVISGTLDELGAWPFYRKREKERAIEALRSLGLMKLKNKSFSKLSGGQKQKVLLARALASARELLFLDEPSNNLDYRSRKKFYENLKKLNEEGMTILMITHDLDAEDLIGNKVLSIEDGEIKMEKTEKFLEKYR